VGFGMARNKNHSGGYLTLMWKSRITRVSTTPTMLKQATQAALVLALALIALILPPKRSKEFECHPPHEHSPTVPLQMTGKKTTTLNREKRPPMLVPRNQANGEGNPWLLLQHQFNAPAPCSCLRGELGWLDKKSPQENLLPREESSSPLEPTGNDYAAMQLWQMIQIILPYKDRHCTDKLH
jgi:hypothetical protein